MRKKKVKNPFGNSQKGHTDIIDMVTDKELAELFNSLTWKDSPSKYNECAKIKELPVFWQRWLYSDNFSFELDGMYYLMQGGELTRRNPKTIKIKPLPPRWKTIEIK